MTDFLLFTLYAPLSSWGDIAVGESRGTWDRPSRSAVLGLLGAGLGVLREDDEAQTALSTGYGIAVRLDAGGTPLDDYHTTQTVSASVVKKRRPATRAELLAVQDRETILSRRSYRQDALATAAVWMRGQPRWTLSELAGALRQPVFVLYAGRKSNALGLPLDPEIVPADTLRGAFAGRTYERPSKAGFDLDRLLRHAPVPEVSHDPCDGFASGMGVLRRAVRRDVPTDRHRWQFVDRVVEVGYCEPDPSMETP